MTPDDGEPAGIDFDEPPVNELSEPKLLDAKAEG